MESRLDLLDLFLSSTGRLARVPFLIAALALLGLGGAFESLGSSPVHRFGGWIVYPALLFSTACILSKRLHDRGLAGWWAFVPVIALTIVWPAPHAPLGVASGALLAAVAIYLVFARGQSGWNRFGPAP